VDSLFPSYRYLDFPAGLAQFSKEVRSQLDLSLEAANLVRFRALFKDDPEVTFPEPLFVTKDVLVMEFVPGQLLTNLLEEEASTPEEEAFRKSIASVGMTAFFRMLKNNLVHGDLHAGNIIVSREPHRPHVHLIDVGIVVQLQPSQRDNFWALFSALVMRDGERAAQEMMERGGRIPGVTDEAGFKREMAQIFHDLPMSFKSAPLAKALVGVLDAAARNRVLLDSTFVTLISSCIVLEGTGRKLNPDLSLFQLAKNMLKESRHHA
jgi:predicted unusual protein kinase regulating ubiquinone biosynthesis (AarF/ABC1/UbiB family)